MSKWILSEEIFNIKNMPNYESLMYQGNGYIGIRNSFEEKYVSTQRATLINGIFNASEGEVSELAVLPDTTNFDMTVNGHDFSMLTGKTDGYMRELNMENGECIRKLLWTTPDGKRVSFEFRRFVSDVKKHIFAQKIIIYALDDIQLICQSGIDGKVTNSGVSHFGPAVLKHYGDKVIGLSMKTLQSGVSVGVCSAFKCDKETEFKVVTDRRGIYFKFALNLNKGESVVIEKISAYASSRDFKYSENENQNIYSDCFSYVQSARVVGYDGLLEESALAWAKYWNEKSVSIISDNSLYESTMVFSQYHLKIMANGEDNRLGIGAKALSGEGYKGHSFWDTEIFILPYYIFNFPQTARKLLEYRYSLLGIACEKAKKYGFEGAMYPWESAWLEDGEVCPEWGDVDIETGERRQLPMPRDEVHISADIAYAVWLYFIVTNDVEFMKKCGYEIVILTAYFWTTKAEERNGRYEILNVIGPDEYKEGVDNNAYTNYMAYFNMELALKYLSDLDGEEVKKLSERYDLLQLRGKISEVKDRLYLPAADEDDILPQFDGFSDLTAIDITEYKESNEVFTILSDYPFEAINNMQVCKQADNVMLFYTLKNRFSKEVMKKTFKYYEERTLHDSSLSMCMHSVVASYIGESEFAQKLYRDCCVVDYGEENNNSQSGIHAAAIGGIWIAVVMGFCGLRAEEEGLYLNNSLPAGIRGIEFPVTYRGSELRVKMLDDNYQIKRISGESQEVIINGEKIVV